jgi:hypothetical protein
VDLVGSFIVRTPSKTNSLLALIMIDPDTGWFEIVKGTNKSETFIQESFHNTWLARYLLPQFIVFENRIMGEFKHEFKKCVTIMELKSNQLQVTTINSQVNAIIERVHKVVNDMFRSFDLENNNDNQVEQEDNPFDFFLQSIA